MRNLSAWVFDALSLCVAVYLILSGVYGKLCTADALYLHDVWEVGGLHGSTILSLKFSADLQFLHGFLFYNYLNTSKKIVLALSGL